VILCVTNVASKLFIEFNVLILLNIVTSNL
jgi:hypothetical protein